MAQYTWLCEEESCQHVTTVQRKMADYEIPPDACEKCQSKKLKRIIAEWKEHQWIKPWGQSVPWHNESHGPRGRIREK